MPHGQLALLFEDVQEGLREVTLFLRMDDGHQWMSRTIGVPKRQGSVVGKIAFVNLTVTATVLTIDIREDGRSRHGVKERRVEDGFVIEIGGFYLDFAKFFVPGSIGIVDNSVKIPVLDFGTQVGFGIVNAHGRDANTRQQWLHVLPYGEDTHAVALHFLELQRLRKFGKEINALVFCPAF